MKTLVLLLLSSLFAVGQTCETQEMPSNGSIDGALTETDCTVRDFIRSETSNLKADAFRLTLRERLVLRVRMTSTAIDSYLYLLTDGGSVVVRNDNTGTGRNAEINVQLAAGTYTIVAATAVTGLGAYQLTTATRPAKSCSAQDLALTGEAIEGDLTDNDCTGVDLALNATDTTPVDVYRIDAARASVLDISMTSSAVTPMVSLYDSRGRRLGTITARSTVARLQISVPAGTYTLRAGTGRTASGTYRLTALREDRRVCQPVKLVSGETVNAEFTTSDCRLADVLMFEQWLGPVDQYTLEVKERAVMKVRMQSPRLDSVLILLEPEFELPLASNNNAAQGTLDSELYVSLGPGTYTVLALDNYGDAGRYSVTLDVEQLRPCPATTINAPGTAAGTLDTGGCRLMDLNSPSTATVPAARFTMNVAERAWTTVSAAGTGMTPMVELRHSDGGRIGIDGPVREKAVLLEPGSYTVQVSSRVGTGEFTLTTATRPPAPCEATALPLGETLSGELTTTDCLEQEVLPFVTVPTSRADLWKVEPDGADMLRAEVGTENAWPYVFIFDSNMKVIAFDINLTISPGARIAWRPQAGTYYVMVGTYTGPTKYTVRVAPESTGTSQ